MDGHGRHSKTIGAVKNSLSDLNNFSGFPFNPVHSQFNAMAKDAAQKEKSSKKRRESEMGTDAAEAPSVAEAPADGEPKKKKSKKVLSPFSSLVIIIGHGLNGC
jgi:hypothetical protein